MHPHVLDLTHRMRSSTFAVCSCLLLELLMQAALMWRAASAAGRTLHQDGTPDKVSDEYYYYVSAKDIKAVPAPPMLQSAAMPRAVAAADERAVHQSLPAALLRSLTKQPHAPLIHIYSPTVLLL